MRSSARQQQLKFRTWGGRRAGAGRKPNPGSGVPHEARPLHAKAHPVHVTLRARRRLPSLRKEVVFRALQRALGATARSWFRIVHYSVQVDHVHLLAEADDAQSLSRGLRGATVRFARAINRAAGRRGHVWGDRYHARALRTPREVRNALVYVLANWKKHVAGAKGLDRRSSAASFDGWKSDGRLSAAPPPLRARASDAPCLQAASTWLLRVGWKRHGPIDLGEAPAADHRGDRKRKRAAPQSRHSPTHRNARARAPFVVR
jgi:putative transposase